LARPGTGTVSVPVPADGLDRPQIGGWRSIGVKNCLSIRAMRNLLSIFYVDFFPARPGLKKAARSSERTDQ